MSNRIRKFEDGNTKRKKKLKSEALTKSLKGSLLKFVKPKKDDVNQSMHLDNETTNNETTNVETQNIDETINNETTTNVETSNYEETTNVETLNNDEPTNDETTTSVETPNNDETVNKPLNLYDPSRWTNINNNMRDLLVEKGPIKVNDYDFPKDECLRSFNSSYYIRKLMNGEKYERKWLVYCIELDRVFCFCCKLFNKNSCKSKLANESSNNWRNIGAKLKKHE